MFKTLAALALTAVLAAGCSGQGAAPAAGGDGVPDTCEEAPRSDGGPDRSALIGIDVSQSEADQLDSFVSQTETIVENVVGSADSAPSIEIQVFAQNESVLADPVPLFDRPIRFDFDAEGNGYAFGQYRDMCVEEFTAELQSGLEVVRGTDTFGAATFASSFFAQRDTTDNVLVLFGDGWATRSCGLYGQPLTNHDAFEEILDTCTDGSYPALDGVTVYQGGVGARDDGDPDALADDLISLYETFWPLTGASPDSVVAPVLNLDLVK